MLPPLDLALPYYEMLDEEGVERIHDASMRILEEIGIDFRDDEAIAYWKDARADVEGYRVRIDRASLMDLVAKRHLHVVYSLLRYSDKPFMGATTARERAEDTVAMARIAFGDEFVANHTVLAGVLNCNSPLVWDATDAGRAEGLLREQPGGDRLPVRDGGGEHLGEHGWSGGPAQCGGARRRRVRAARASRRPDDLRALPRHRAHAREVRDRVRSCSTMRASSSGRWTARSMRTSGRCAAPGRCSAATSRRRWTRRWTRRCGRTSRSARRSCRKGWSRGRRSGQPLGELPVALQRHLPDHHLPEDRLEYLTRSRRDGSACPATQGFDGPM